MNHLTIAFCGLFVASVICTGLASAGGFVPNLGQLADVNGTNVPEVSFTYQGKQGNMYFMSGRIATVALHTILDSSQQPLNAECYRSDIEFLGARPTCVPEGIDQLREYSNYYLAHCPDGILHVPSFAKIVYRELYPGIDAVVYENTQSLEYDFVLRAGANLADIVMAVHGGVPRVDGDGSLVIATVFGEERHSVPRCVEDGKNVAGRFVVHDSIVTIIVPQHDSANALVIDPSISWSTLFAGNANDVMHNVAIGPTNHIYVAGYSWSTDFPTTVGTVQPVLSGQSDAVVARFDTGGNREWATFFGGSAIDLAIGLTVDRAGACWITGDCGSADLPTTLDAFQPVYGGGSYDGYVAKFDSTGKRLFASFAGGGAFDGGVEIAADSNGNVAVDGLTASNDFPVGVGGFQPASGGGYDVWVLRLSSTGAFLWGSYLGGAGDERGRGCATDDAGNVYVTGMTSSSNFPLVRSAQTTLQGGTDAYIAKFNAAGKIVWSTIFGGNGYDGGTRVKCDRVGNVYFEGPTASTNLPTTASSAQRTYGGGSFDAFVTKLDSGGVPQWTTYVGGSGEENNDEISYFSGLSIAQDNSAWTVGRTTSSDLHGTALFPSTFSGVRDVFVARISNNGSAMATAYIGGSDDDMGRGIAVDSLGAIVVVGSTSSTNFPTTPGAFQQGAKGQQDGFIVRITTCSALLPTVTSTGSSTVCFGDSAILFAQPGFATYQWSDGTIGQRLKVTTSGSYFVSVSDSAGCTGVSAPFSVIVLPPVVVVTSPRDSASLCNGDTLFVSATPGFASYHWSNGANGLIDTILVPGNYFVAVRDTNGCIGVSAPLNVTVGNSVNVPTTANDSNVLCYGDSLVIDASSGFKNYQWSDGTSGPRLVVRKSGLYFVNATTSGGCSGKSKSIAVTILPPVTVATNPADSAFLCLGDSLVVTATNGFSSYRWNDGTNGDHIVITKPGTYAVAVVDAHGCVGVSKPLVVVVGNGATVATTVTGTQMLCDGDSLTIDASPGFASYVWSDGTVGSRIRICRAGIYTVSATTANGCHGASFPINVIVYPAVQVTTVPRDTVLICPGDSVFVAANPGFRTYQWSSGGRGMVDTITSPGTYSVNVVDSNGCTGKSLPVYVEISSSAGDTTDFELLPFNGAAGDTVHALLVLHNRRSTTTTQVNQVRLHLRVDASLLFPVDSSARFILSGGEWIITEDVSLRGDTIFGIGFVAALGDTDQTLVHLDSIEILDHCAAAARGSDALFTLSGVCDQGGNRFYIDTYPLKLSQNVPNPIATVATVQFNAIETGFTTLTVYDIFGRVAAMPFAQSVAQATYSARIDATGLPEGSYFYVLRTPTKSVRRLMEVVK